MRKTIEEMVTQTDHFSDIQKLVGLKGKPFYITLGQGGELEIAEQKTDGRWDTKMEFEDVDEMRYLGQCLIDFADGVQLVVNIKKE